jgi:hypothetical protein
VGPRLNLHSPGVVILSGSNAQRTEPPTYCVGGAAQHDGGGVLCDVVPVVK